MSSIQKVDKSEAIERVVVGGDLSKLSAEERVNYYKLVCESVGLNPLTRPLEYITLNNKLTLYARKDATDQLRTIHQVSIKIVAREVVEGCYVVTAQASFPSGRVDESIGAVPIENLKGEARANALMKCETKAKRRVTLSACGLGMLDETEIETIPSARPPADVQRTTAPIPIQRPSTSGGGPPPGLLEAAEKAALGKSQVPTPPDPIPALAERLVDEIGDKHGELQKVFKEADPDETIDLARQRNLHREFKAAIPETAAESTKKAADVIFREWLKNRGFVGPDAQGTTKTIPVLLFDETKADAVKFAGSLR